METMTKVLNLYPIDYPFETLIDRVQKGKLLLQPVFQRKYKWDKDGEERCSRFIESCLMRIPIPACYFAENEEGQHIVIDGVQRITTINRFFDDEFALTGLTVYKELNGKKCSELGNLKEALAATTIRCIVLRNENPKELIQEIFARLNQGSVILTPQEIRHAIYPGGLDQLLEKLAKTPKVRNFKAPKSESKDDDSREGDELVLRFFALDSDLDGYEENLSCYLDRYMQANANMDAVALSVLEEKFNSSLRKCLAVFGDKAFINLGKPNARQSSSLWDLQMIGMIPYSESEILQNKEKLRTAFEELCRQSEFSKTLSGRLAFKASILKRRRMWSSKIQSIIGH